MTQKEDLVELVAQRVSGLIHSNNQKEYQDLICRGNLFPYRNHCGST